MQLAEIEVKKVDVSGPNSGKFGEFFSHKLVSTDGQFFSKIEKTDAPLASVGETVKILFTSKESTGRDGKTITFNNISKLDRIASKPSSSVSSIAEVKSPIVENKSSKPLTSETNSSNLTAKDKSIARMNAVSSAISLSNANVTTVEVEEVFELADKILAYTLEPYGESKLK